MFWDMYEFLCKKNGKSPNAFAKEIGAGTSACTYWKKGAFPKGETLLKIANCFDCSVDYLLGRTQNPLSHTDNGKTMGLSSEEQRLIAGYRELNDEGQKQAVIYVTEMLLQNVRYTQKSNSDNVKEA